MVEKKPAKETEVPATSAKTCFIMMPIADQTDYEPGHFNRVYQYLIKPACVKAGYHPIRADDNKASNMIMFDILKKIVECDMAICDLSSRNANVFYELGLRQAFNKKTILITDNRLPAPFDISAFRYVPYSHTLRVDTVDREIPGIINMLKETENQPADDVNSIIKLLQIQPSKVENISLNQEDSVMYGMLLNIQKQLLDIKSKEVFSSSRYASYLNKKALPNVLSDIDLAKELSGQTFTSIRRNYPEQLFSLVYLYNGEVLGHLESLDDEYVTFAYKGKIASFLEGDSTLDQIYVY